MKRLLQTALLLATLATLSCSNPGGAEPTSPLPKPTRDLKETSTVSTAVFAGGCFWCVEAFFEELRGVTSVVSGYAGGDAATAHYDIVSAGRTKHAESVRVTYDPRVISYGTLLHVFMSLHHPTQVEGQGPDWGHQYRSAIFFATPEQKEVAQAYIQQLTAAKVFAEPIATELEPLDEFYPAEDYHQDYVRIHPNQGYVRQWALPKLEKLHQLFPDLLK